MNFFIKLAVFLVVVGGIYYFWGDLYTSLKILVKTVFLDYWLVWLAISLFSLYFMGHPKPKESH